MHCFLQYGQRCMWRIRVIHLRRPHEEAVRRLEKIGKLSISLTITWKKANQINICIVSWMIWIFRLPQR